MKDFTSISFTDAISVLIYITLSHQLILAFVVIAQRLLV